MSRLFLKFLAIGLVALFLTGCLSEEEAAEVTKQVEERVTDPAKKLAALKSVVALLDTDKRFDHYFKTCPADSFGKEYGRIITTVESLTNKDDDDENICPYAPDLCFSMCKDGDSENCFDLGLALQDAEDELGKVPYRKAFAFACAAGSAAGCTNRGAGIINVPIESDPISLSPDSEKYGCSFKLFKRACDENDEWGCTMYGQALSDGQGVKPDKQAALEAFDKACLPDMNKDGCAYAKKLRAPLE